MIIEKIVFGVLSIALFTIFFLKMIGKNNATYVYLLVVQFIWPLQGWDREGKAGGYGRGIRPVLRPARGVIPL